MITYTDIYKRTQRQAKSNDSNDLIAIKQDINIGYGLFNDMLARYYTRKQQFCDLAANQFIYQTPIDCIRVTGMTATINANYQLPVANIVSEEEWRTMTAFKYSSSYPRYYFISGNDEIQLWPIPSQNVTNGFRLYYQPDIAELSIDDITSTSTSATITATQGSATITASSTVFSTALAGLTFQVTGELLSTAYEIVSATTSTLTLKSAYIGPTGSGKAWRIGQTLVLPPAYVDAPMHYALGNFFASKGNDTRAAQHLGTVKMPGMFFSMVEKCKEEYSKSTTGNIITDGDVPLNPWTVPPLAPV